MNIKDTKEKILQSDEFVISELRKVQTLYELKKVIRYDHNREIESHTESVAEHVFAMQCLIDYFLPFEDPENKWDQNKIRIMTTYHDIDEIETGDTPSHFKSKSEIAEEWTTTKQVIERLPETI